MWLIVAVVFTALVVLALKYAYVELVGLVMGFPDVEHVGKPAAKKGEHAVVIGGSWGGLITAGVLSEHFDKVTVLERDVIDLETQGTARRGVPQHKHAHLVYPVTLRILRRMCGNIDEEFQKLGVKFIDFSSRLRWFQYGGWKLHNHLGLECFCATRPVFEQGMRRALLKTKPNIEVRGNVVVQSLKAEGNRVIGVELEDKTKREVSFLRADFVVDSTGRRAKGSTWLEELGWPQKPPVEEVNSHICYSSQVRRPPEGYQDEGWDVLAVYSEPPKKKFGYILRVENDQWLFTLMGMAKDQPPADAEGFAEYSKQLAHPMYSEKLAQSRPPEDSLEKISKFLPARGSCMVHYSAITMPENFVAVGDAVAAFNPIYAQGITCATLGALTLDRTLRRHSSLLGVSTAYHKLLGWRLHFPWTLGKMEDYQYEESEGADKHSPLWNIQHQFLKHALILCASNADICAICYRLLTMTEFAAAILHPRYSLPILKHWILGS